MKKYYNYTKIFLSLRYIIPLLLLSVIIVFLFLSIRSCQSTIDNNFEKVSGIAEKFRTGNITETFISSIPEIISTNGNILEIAVMNNTEIFTRTDNQSLFWGTFELGENIVEIRVPVTYRYHIQLSDPWHLEVNDNTCIVYAPEIRASQPPAINTDKMQKLVIKEGWARFDAKRSLEELQQSLTPKLMQAANNEKRISLVDEKAKSSVAEFVKNWLLREDQWGDNKFNNIKVYFPTDKEFHNRIQTIQPEAELER